MVQEGFFRSENIDRGRPCFEQNLPFHFLKTRIGVNVLKRNWLLILKKKYNFSTKKVVISEMFWNPKTICQLNNLTFETQQFLLKDILTTTSCFLDLSSIPHKFCSGYYLFNIECTKTIQ